MTTLQLIATAYRMIARIFAHLFRFADTAAQATCKGYAKVIRRNGYSPQLLKRLLWEVRNARRNKETARKRAVGGVFGNRNNNERRR